MASWGGDSINYLFNGVNHFGGCSFLHVYYNISDKMLNIETERKFLVKDSSYKDMAVSSHRIIQGYVCKENGRTVRVRIADDRAYLTVKGPSADGISRLEWEIEIAAEDAKDLLPLCQDGLIEKIRHIVLSVSRLSGRFAVSIKTD